MKGTDLDMRTSTLPTIYGEKSSYPNSQEK